LPLQDGAVPGAGRAARRARLRRSGLRREYRRHERLPARPPRGARTRRALAVPRSGALEGRDPRALARRRPAARGAAGVCVLVVAPALRHRGDARAPAPGGARRGGAARARVPPGAPAPSRRPRARRGRSERAAARARSGDGAADQRRGAPARVPVGVARPRRLSHGLAQRGPRDPQRAIRALTVRALECSGAPRDLGRDLGGALRAELRAAFRAERSLRGRLAAFRRTNAEVQLHSDLRRYFPHHAEWLEGLALGSGVSLRALVGALPALSAPGGPGGVAVGGGA